MQTRKTNENSPAVMRVHTVDALSLAVRHFCEGVKGQK